MTTGLREAVVAKNTCYWLLLIDIDRQKPVVALVEHFLEGGQKQEKS